MKEWLFAKMNDPSNMLKCTLTEAMKRAEAEVAEWGLTPGRVTSLVQALLRVAEEWGEEAKHFR